METKQEEDFVIIWKSQIERATELNLVKVENPDTFLKMVFFTPFFIKARLNKIKKELNKDVPIYEVRAPKYFFEKYLHVPDFLLEIFNFQEWHKTIMENLDNEELLTYKYLLSTFDEGNVTCLLKNK
jgi:hypothetical protein